MQFKIDVPTYDKDSDTQKNGTDSVPNITASSPRKSKKSVEFANKTIKNNTAEK
jgi:hypothetical protein